MPIDRIKAGTLRLTVDGNKSIDVKLASKRGAELNRALLDPANFKEFAADPKKFVGKFDFQIDRDISDQLTAKLTGIKDLEELKKFVNPIDPVASTVWAIAVGSYSLASSKIAVAF